MNRLLRKITAVVSAAAVAIAGVNFGGVGGFTASAADPTGYFTVTDGEYGTDYTYENNVLTIKSDTPITISGSGTTTTDTIVVEKNKDANITLAGVNIDVSGCAFKIEDNSTGNVTVTLADDSHNVLKSGDNCAGLQKNGTNGSLTIDGTGSLTAVGGNNGAGIGGNQDAMVMNITINGGIISATGGIWGAGIGGGYYSSAVIYLGGAYSANYSTSRAASGPNASYITINGGIVTATGGDYGSGIGGGRYGYASNITINGGTVTATGGIRGAGIGGGEYAGSSDIMITGGSVKATAGSEAYSIGGGYLTEYVTPTNGTDNLYLMVIDNPDGGGILIDGTPFNPVSHGAETKVYAYLTGENHSVSVDGVSKNYCFNTSDETFYEDIPEEPSVLTVSGGEKDIDYIYSDNVLTVLKATPMTISNSGTSSTTDTIVIADDVSADITLSGINIDVSSTSDTCAFMISSYSNTNVKITLEGTNTLISGENCAGLQKNGTNGSLTIDGTGSLTATGGYYGSGIGGGSGGKASNIIINGGTVTASGGSHSSGIGGGYNGDASNITINGGSVTATGGDYGAGIGGGVDKNASIITINGGTVNATGGTWGAGIGGGDYVFHGGDGTDITITGGTVTATGGSYSAGIGGGNGGNASNIKISGGAVTATGSAGGAGIGGGNDGSSTDITISGGSVNSSGFGSTPTNGNENVYRLVINNPTSGAIYIDGLPFTPVAHGTENKVYAFLTGESHTITVNDISENYCFNTIDNNFYAGNSMEDYLDFTVTGGIYGTDYGVENDALTVYKDTALKISNKAEAATTQQCIAVAKDVNANITLSRVNIDVSSKSYTCAFMIARNSVGNVNVILEGTNVLKSGDSRAGLQKNSTGGSLTIGGTGSLTAKGGNWCAGIGSAGAGTATNITIISGTVTAIGGFFGAGIGGGHEGNASNITINGGTVTATGGSNGAGIGGGRNGEGSDIKITGGSVKAVAGSGTNVIGGGAGNNAVTPTNGTDNVYLLTIANPTGADVYIDGNLYSPKNHSAAGTNDTNLYAYLTGTNHSVSFGTGESAVTTEYKFYSNKFLPVPKASDFDFTKPENLIYTGTEKTADVAVKPGITDMGNITAVNYFDADGNQLESAPVVPGEYTVKIDVAKGDNYTEATYVTDTSWTFTITPATLTASGTGVASGTYGTTLGNLEITGITVEFDNQTIEGTWKFKSSEKQDADYVPSVSDSAKYTATFTPNVNPTYYNTLTVEVALDISKANAPTIADIPVSYNWAATGEKTVTISGLPDYMGNVGAATFVVTDTNDILDDNSVVYGQGRLRFTLNTNTAEKVGKTAIIKATIPSQNYKDITVNVVVTITAKQDKEAPALTDFTLSVDFQSDNTYKATINTELTGVEYSFDGTNWSSTNTAAIAHGTTVTGYIRYAETEEYNASPYSSKTAATAHGTLTHHDAKAATCTEDGNIEYWTCDSCGKYFSDENGKTEITQAQTVLTKLGHKWAEKYNFDKDVHWQTCERCGVTTEKEAHVSGGEATADSAKICTVCGYEIAPKIGQTAAPLFSPNGGTFGSIQTVSITSATEGATIYYTTDGSEPTTESNKYTAALTIDKTTTIKAIAVKDELTNSEVKTAEFTIILPVAAPVISPNGGSFTGSQTVTINCATEGAAIYYTTDGSAPTTSSKLYESSFTISATTTVKAIAVKDGMTDSAIVSATFTKKTSSGGTGGGGGGSSRPSTPTTTNPSIGGTSKSWSDVAADLGKLTSGSEATIELNGSTTVPVDVIKAIADTGSNVKLVINSAYAWVVDGADITAPAAADLTFVKTASTKSDGLRGVEGTQFRINNTNIPTNLEIAFKKQHAGKFANLYKNVDGKLTFVTCAKLGADGKVILSNVTEKGDYVAMLCELSDRLGDMDNDGIMNTKDALAVLKDAIGMEKGTNPLVADVNGDGFINAKDALIILKKFLGIE